MRKHGSRIIEFNRRGLQVVALSFVGVAERHTRVLRRELVAIGRIHHVALEIDIDKPMVTVAPGEHLAQYRCGCDQAADWSDLGLNGQRCSRLIVGGTCVRGGNQDWLIAWMSGSHELRRDDPFSGGLAISLRQKRRGE